MHSKASSLAFLLLLATLTSQQGASLDATVDVSQGSSSDLPSTSPQRTQSMAGAEALTSATLAPSNWNFLQRDILGSGSKWIAPSSDFSVRPQRYVATYTIQFHTDCPQNSVTLKFSATGSSFVFLNDNSILQWGAPYPRIHTYVLKTPELKCGCNILRILVYNFYYPSPAALTYSLSQDTTGCYDCQNLGVTFYNRKTCQCECASTCDCKNSLQSWSGYPACGCKCTFQARCISGTNFNYRTCKCECP